MSGRVTFSELPTFTNRVDCMLRLREDQSLNAKLEVLKQPALL